MCLKQRAVNSSGSYLFPGILFQTFQGKEALQPLPFLDREKSVIAMGRAACVVFTALRTWLKPDARRKPHFPVTYCNYCQ